MAPDQQREPLVFNSVEEYRQYLGEVPDPCPCHFFYGGYVCDWHISDEALERWLLGEGAV